MCLCVLFQKIIASIRIQKETSNWQFWCRSIFRHIQWYVETFAMFHAPINLYAECLETSPTCTRLDSELSPNSSFSSFRRSLNLKSDRFRSLTPQIRSKKSRKSLDLSTRCSRSRSKSISRLRKIEFPSKLVRSRSNSDISEISSSSLPITFLVTKTFIIALRYAWLLKMKAISARVWTWCRVIHAIFTPTSSEITNATYPLPISLCGV